jgi:hypothetical protein
MTTFLLYLGSIEGKTAYFFKHCHSKHHQEITYPELTTQYLHKACDPDVVHAINIAKGVDRKSISDDMNKLYFTKPLETRGSNNQQKLNFITNNKFSNF